MVDKILSKDKNYNSHVSKVTEKEIKIEILRKDINALEAEYQKLKNDCKFYLMTLRVSLLKILLIHLNSQNE